MKGLKGMKGAKGLKGLGPTNVRLPKIELYAGPLGQKNEDPLVYQIWQVMGGKEGDMKIARQCATLKEKIPAATTPELVTYVWLKERNYDFEYQVEAQGGRRDTGGSVIDFVVKAGKTWAIRVQGDYFHDTPEQRAADEIRRRLLIGTYAGKYQIDGVVDVWESMLYRDRDTVLTMAVAGYQLPH